MHQSILGLQSFLIINLNRRFITSRVGEGKEYMRTITISLLKITKRLSSFVLVFDLKVGSILFYF